jgi:hypothetical protein
MSSLAELPELIGFFSYSREDDEAFKGTLSGLRDGIPPRAERPTRTLEEDLSPVAGSGGDRFRQTVGNGNPDSDKSINLFHSHCHTEVGQQQTL